MYITIPKGRNQGTVRKCWTKARLKLTRENSKSWFPWLLSKGLDGSTIPLTLLPAPLSLGLVPSMCNSLWQAPRDSGLFSILRLPVQLRLHFHSSLHTPPHRNSTATCLAPVTLCNHRGGVHNPFILGLFMTLKSEPQDGTGKFRQQLGVDLNLHESLFY